MFNYSFAEQSLPWTQCPNCNKKLHFHGDYYPTVAVCGNCGQHIDLTNALKGLKYPNVEYDKDGNITEKEKQKIANIIGGIDKNE